MRRTIAWMVGLAVCLGCASIDRSAAAEEVFRVTLLGTGNPIPAPDRFGPATLVEAGEEKLLFDAGRGATIRLFQLGVPISRIDPLFITHLHSDHTVGIPDVWLTGWVPGAFGQRSKPMHIIGPTGTGDMVKYLTAAYDADVQIRLADQHLPAAGAEMRANEFAHDGVVFERNGVRVTAFEVDHGEHIKPAYGYRIDYARRSVVISGDTRLNENVVKFGTGVDVLVHEVAGAPPSLLGDPQIQGILAHHTSPQEAGTVFTRAHPKLAVYTHLSLPRKPGVPPVTMAELAAQTRETYSGPLEVGEDLMRIEVAGDVPVVKRHVSR
jgi:ribonuclease Z